MIVLITDAMLRAARPCLRAPVQLQEAVGRVRVGEFGDRDGLGDGDVVEHAEGADEDAREQESLSVDAVAHVQVEASSRR
ncbi:hypothetical protein GCM10018965_001580 [Nonomuraea roseola]